MSEKKSNCSDWTAIHDFMPPGPARLTVRGKCTFPTPGYTVTLKKKVPQGINPAILLLDKTEAGPPFAIFEGWVPRTMVSGDFANVDLNSPGGISAVERINMDRGPWRPPFENRERWGSMIRGAASVRQPPA
jgi:hypothetical protein